MGGHPIQTERCQTDVKLAQRENGVTRRELPIVPMPVQRVTIVRRVLNTRVARGNIMTRLGNRSLGIVKIAPRGHTPHQLVRLLVPTVPTKMGRDKGHQILVVTKQAIVLYVLAHTVVQQPVRHQLTKANQVDVHHVVPTHGPCTILLDLVMSRVLGVHLQYHGRNQRGVVRVRGLRASLTAGAIRVGV